MAAPLVAVGSVLRALGDLVVPEICAGCALPGADPLCDRCARCFAGYPRPGPASAAARLPVLRAAADYRGPVRAAILAYKEQGVRVLAPPLGQSLSVAVAAVLGASQWSGGPVLLVPAPSSPRAQRERGFAPVALLAAEAVRVLCAAGVEVEQAAVLRQRRRVRDQAGLSTRARAMNLAGALEMCPQASVRDRALVLVDDVVTTGSTLVEAARVLTAAGGQVLGAAAVAATPRSGHPGHRRA